MKDIHIQYKSDTGKAPEKREIEYWNTENGVVVDSEILDFEESQGFIAIPDPDYIAWLEEKVEALQKERHGHRRAAHVAQ